MWWNLWAHLTDAQASLISTAMLIVAGGLGVLLSAALFGGRVRNLETALNATEEKLQAVLRQSSDKLEAFNHQVADKLSTVDEQFSATLDALGQLRNSVAGLQDSADKNADTLRDQLATHWAVVAAAIEEFASDQRIHGKTRARYSRIPRRSLEPLLTTLIAENHVPPEKIQPLREALSLWSWHRNGKPQLLQPDVDKMKELAIRVSPTYKPS